MIRSLCLAALGLMLCGCASYWSNRGRDTADLFTLTGTTGAGIKFQAGPIQIAPAAMLVDIGGLRGGEAFSSDLGEESTIFPMDVGMAWWSSSVLVVPGEPRMEDRGKAYCAFPAGAESEELFARHTGTVPFITIPRATWGKEKLTLSRVSPAYPGQIELAFAIGAGLRVGTNVVEWVDFACGWFGLDLLDDDLAKGKGKKRASHRPVLQVPDSDKATE